MVNNAYELWLQYEVRTDDITLICLYIDSTGPRAAVGKGRSFFSLPSIRPALSIPSTTHPTSCTTGGNLEHLEGDDEVDAAHSLPTTSRPLRSPRGRVPPGGFNKPSKANLDTYASVAALTAVHTPKSKGGGGEGFAATGVPTPRAEQSDAAAATAGGGAGSGRGSGQGVGGGQDGGEVLMIRGAMSGKQQSE